MRLVSRYQALDQMLDGRKEIRATVARSAIAVEDKDIDLESLTLEDIRVTVQ